MNIYICMCIYIYIYLYVYKVEGLGVPHAYIDSYMDIFGLKGRLKSWGLLRI